MARFPLHLLVLAFLCLLLVSPATAGLVLSNVAFTPDAPLTPGGQQQVVTTYAIIPSGSTTFARGHSLQMQTDLTDAQWTIQVTLDGRDAARQTASGSAAFVNGVLLSYSTDHDVGIVVKVAGTVPAGAASPFTVLTVKELDNSGNAVPGSDLAVSQPVAGSVTVPPATSALPTLTPPVVTTATSQKSPGPVPPAIFAAIALSVIVARSCARRT